ncbi:MAG: Fumarate reductase, NapC/NirT cytochrome c subunit [Thermoanaerobacterales bacterium 50_218]|nr:MAG: Fumarate reductase, NapC/NirT cytochrome c subunit [Thermoanaerobacterales bacterium 50_218]
MKTEGESLSMEAHNGQTNEVRKKAFFRPKVLLGVLAALVVVAAVAGGVLFQASKKPSFCATCHIIEPYYNSWKGGDLLAAKHAEAGVDCLDCHHKSTVAKIGEGINYLTGNYENPLKERDFSMEECLSCHKDDFAEAVAATDFGESNPHDSHLGEIECHLCHKMHRQSEVYCAQCHDFSWYKDLDKSWKTELAGS